MLYINVLYVCKIRNEISFDITKFNNNFKKFFRGF